MFTAASRGERALIPSPEALSEQPAAIGAAAAIDINSMGYPPGDRPTNGQDQPA